MTFDELAAAILSHPDTSVEISDAYVGSTHSMVQKAQSNIAGKILNGIDPRKDFESIRSKRWLIEALQEVEEGRININMKIVFNNYLKP